MRNRVHGAGRALIINMIRFYPLLKAERDELQSQSLVQSMNGMPGSHDVNRTTEGYALKTLPEQAEAMYWAVHDAFEKADEETKRLITIVDFKREMTISEYAYRYTDNVVKTTQRRRSAFVEEVAKKYKFL